MHIIVFDLLCKDVKEDSNAALDLQHFKTVKETDITHPFHIVRNVSKSIYLRPGHVLTEILKYEIFLRQISSLKIHLNHLKLVLYFSHYLTNTEFKDVD